MTKTLDVYLHDDLVGHLTQDKGGRLGFSYADAWLKKLDATALSRSLPLQKESIGQKFCQGFFAGLLPEEGKRKILARRLGISEQNDFALLARIGGECAGAVTFVAPGGGLPDQDNRYRELTDKKLLETLTALPHHPLLTGENGIRLSLAGAQDKIAVHVCSDRISLPLENAPSTHILKPAIPRFEGLVFNEDLCLKLAAGIGLPAATSEIGRVGDIDYLLVERYDRKRKSDHAVRRLHQEDFCQALGLPPHMKYQSEGGPSLKRCFALLREASSAPVIDLQRLLDAVIFNVLIGNHDAHGKNFSLLYDEGQTRLAPFYDLICTVRYPELTKKMAMKIGDESESDKIRPRNFEKLAVDTGLAAPIVKKRVPELAESVLTGLQQTNTNHPEAKKVAEIIHKRCERYIKFFSPPPK